MQVNLDIILENSISRAMTIAKNAHVGQVRKKSGLEYYTHPYNTFLLTKKLGYGTNEQVIALLHDTIEDGKNVVKIMNQIKHLFGPSVLKLVMLLSHDKNVNYNNYILNIANLSKIALRVKLCDMYSNLSDYPTKKQFIKYTNAFKFLLDSGIKIDTKLLNLFKGNYDD